MEREQPNPTTEEVPEEVTPEGLPPEVPRESEETELPGPDKDDTDEAGW